MQGKITSILSSRLDGALYRYGFADLRGLLAPDLSGYGYGIAILRRLDDGIIDGITKGPTMNYFDHYHAVNDELQAVTQLIVKDLEELGIGALAMNPTSADRELDRNARETLDVGFSHKMTATRAGLGWIGKTDLLVSVDFGPRVRLASILIDRVVCPQYDPISESRCGSCNLCVQSCPAVAANGILWNTVTKREKYFNPFKCREYCRKVSWKQIGKEISLCGLCVSICPAGRRNP